VRRCRTVLSEAQTQLALVSKAPHCRVFVHAHGPSFFLPPTPISRSTPSPAILAPSHLHASTTRFSTSAGIIKYGHALSSSPPAGALLCNRHNRRLPPLPVTPAPGVRAHGKGQRRLLRQPVPPPDAGAAEEVRRKKDSVAEAAGHLRSSINM
jgi:hypothetical protein